MVEEQVRDPGEVIKERLKELGLSQAKFSKMVGKSPGWAAARFLPNVYNMLRYFAYKEPETLDRIFRALQWTPEEFAEATGLELPGLETERHEETPPVKEAEKLEWLKRELGISSEEDLIELLEVEKKIDSFIEVAAEPVKRWLQAYKQVIKKLSTAHAQQ